MRFVSLFLLGLAAMLAGLLGTESRAVAGDHCQRVQRVVVVEQQVYQPVQRVIVQRQVVRQRQFVGGGYGYGGQSFRQRQFVGGGFGGQRFVGGGGGLGLGGILNRQTILPAVGAAIGASTFGSPALGAAAGSVLGSIIGGGQ